MLVLRIFDLLAHLIRQGAAIRRDLADLTERIIRMSQQQDQINADVSALIDAAAALEGEVASLKAQIAEGTPPEQLDLSGLDAVTARLKGDSPAAADLPPTDAPVDVPSVESPVEVPVDTAPPAVDVPADQPSATPDA